MSLLTTMLEAVATIKRPKIGQDAQHGTTQDFGAAAKIIASGLPCSFQEAGINVQTLYAQRESMVTTTVYFATDPKCEVDDLMTVTEPRVSNLQVNCLVQGRAQPVARGRLYSVDVMVVGGPGSTI